MKLIEAIEELENNSNEAVRVLVEAAKAIYYLDKAEFTIDMLKIELLTTAGKQELVEAYKSREIQKKVLEDLLNYSLN